MVQSSTRSWEVAMADVILVLAPRCRRSRGVHPTPRAFSACTRRVDLGRGTFASSERSTGNFITSISRLRLCAESREEESRGTRAKGSRAEAGAHGRRSDTRVPRACTRTWTHGTRLVPPLPASARSPVSALFVFKSALCRFACQRTVVCMYVYKRRQTLDWRM